jgi:calcineurin-like phosphoesterase family protein
VLAVSDEVDEGLWRTVRSALDVDVVLACGDLPFEYLGHLMEVVDAPLVFVPGNHDPEVRGYRGARNGLVLRAGLPTEPPWPGGAVNADQAVVDVAGLRIAGLGGCRRYGDGPNQYTDAEQARRAWRLRLSAVRSRLRDRRPVDVLLTHAPPLGVGDREDAPHRGFSALHPLVERLRPTLLLHGHIHPYGEATPDRRLGDTVVRNVVGVHVFDVEPRGVRPRAPAGSRAR